MSFNKDDKILEKGFTFPNPKNSDIKFNECEQRMNRTFSITKSLDKLNTQFKNKDLKSDFIEPKINHLMSFEDTSNLFARQISSADNKIINVNINYNTTINNFEERKKKIEKNDDDVKKYSKNELNKQYNLIFTTFKKKTNHLSLNDINKEKNIEINKDSLNNLEIILLKLFLNEEISNIDLEKLNKIERNILNMIIIRKFNKKLNNFEDNEDENEDYLTLIKTKFQNSLKRSEENHKFILKRGIKNLFDKFKKNNKKKKFKNKNQEEKEFYLYYFSNFINNSVKIENFYFPKK